MKSLQASATTNLNLPADSYIYKILPTSAQSDPYTFQKAAQLAVICSDDSLRLFDAETLRLSPNGVLANVNKSVTSLARTNAEGNVLATCGRDGIVRYWDTRGNKKVLEIKTRKLLTSPRIQYQKPKKSCAKSDFALSKSNHLSPTSYIFHKA